MTVPPIDLRSDTVTRPDDVMRQAMATAEVGDDVYGEDPTVRTLEEEAAAALGTEAALFVPSGTMGNQIALRLHARPGSEVLCDERSHVLLYEVGAMAALSGLQAHPLSSSDGLPSAESFAAAIATSGGFRVPIGVLEVENTHNVAGGRVFARSRLEAILAVARASKLPVHLDGARVFNAATALGTSAAALAAEFDSVMFCVSKGLGAPVGSLLCGSRPFIADARQVRKLLGGGMRQVGVLAAAGLVALRHGPARLAADHRHARRLATALGEMPGIAVDLATVETNIVVARLPEAEPERGAPDPAGRFVAALRAAGVLAGSMDRHRVRFVTHRDLESAAIERAIEIIGGVLTASARLDR